MSVLRSASLMVWTLRGLCVLDLLWLLMVYSRSIRAHRAAQFHARPSTAQGLAGRFIPHVSVVLLEPRGSLDWVRRLSYPSDRLEVLVVVPPDAGAVKAADRPDGAHIVTAASAHPGALLEAGAEAASGDVLVFVPGAVAAGPGFLKRLVAPLVDPWIAAAVPRVLCARPGAGLAARLDDLDRLGRAAAQLGRHVIGAPVMCEGEPFAVRRHAIEDSGGIGAAHPMPDADLVMRIYIRGFAVAYVEEAVALAPVPTWASLSADSIRRTAGLRRLWRTGRRLLRKTKVLEGPEKTDVRWLTRGSATGLWLLVGWVLVGLLRLADTSWAPEAIAAFLLLATFSTTLRMIPYLTLSTAAVQSRRLSVLTLEPWLPIFSLATIWTGSGAALASPFRRTRTPQKEESR